MASDRDLVSSEDHEMNYLLRKWDKKQSKENRETLVEKLKEFKHDDDYQPHNRESFYKYVDDNDVKSLLEDADIDDDDTMVESDEDDTEVEIVKTVIKDDNVQKTIVETEKTIVSNTGSGIQAEQKKSILPLIFMIIAAVIIILLILLGVYICKKNPNLFGQKQKTEEIKENTVVKDEEVKEDTAELLMQAIKNNTPIYFIANKTTLLEGENAKISNIISELKKHDKVKLLIEGHTAKIGKPENELKLSINRAKLIKNMINKEVSVEIETKGYGSKKEAVANPDKNEMKLNRRVEISIID